MVEIPTADVGTSTVVKRHIQPLLEKSLADFPVVLDCVTEVIGLGERRLAVPLEVALLGSDTRA